MLIKLYIPWRQSIHTSLQALRVALWSCKEPRSPLQLWRKLLSCNTQSNLCLSPLWKTKVSRHFQGGAFLVLQLFPLQHPIKWKNLIECLYANTNIQKSELNDNHMSGMRGRSGIRSWVQQSTVFLLYWL